MTSHHPCSSFVHLFFILCVNQLTIVTLSFLFHPNHPTRIIILCTVCILHSCCRFCIMQSEIIDHITPLVFNDFTTFDCCFLNTNTPYVHNLKYRDYWDTYIAYHYCHGIIASLGEKELILQCTGYVWLNFLCTFYGNCVLSCTPCIIMH